MAIEGEIEQAIDVLERALSDSDLPPAVVIQPPDSGERAKVFRGSADNLK